MQTSKTILSKAYINKPFGEKSYSRLQFCMLTDFRLRINYTLLYFEPF